MNNFKHLPENIDSNHVQNICKDIVCQNNGACLDHETEKSVCLCSPPYYGNMCQYKDYCYANPCRAGQVCRQFLNGNYSCEAKQKNNLALSIKITFPKFQRLELLIVFFISYFLIGSMGNYNFYFIFKLVFGFIFDFIEFLLNFSFLFF